MRLALSFVLLSLLAGPASAAEESRPNVLWITCEDLSPIIGPYGDTFATTPHLDAFATKSLRYKTCWSNAPVCAPARTTLITGMYATSLGAEHMRSEVKLPPDWKLYPQVLRDAGYYCTNNSKTDYNVVPNGKAWDDSSNKAHWKNRPDGKPFFAVFNNTVTHESGVHKRKELTHDPAKVRVPAYQPDLPEIREDWAQYYDNATTMDAFVGERLKELADAGLAEDTIVWFYSDHGCGLPRSKRVPFNSGLHVPFLLHVPEKFKHLRPADYVPGGETPRLVSFVDFGPTLLSLCGVKPSANMQGQPFLGKFNAEPRKYLFGYRGRMDERVDVVRSVTDGRYVYVRNFIPEKPQGGYLAYMYRQAGVQAWRAAFEKGGLPPQHAAFFLPKPAEALFDLQNDPDEVNNLVSTAEGRRIGDRLVEALGVHLKESCDLGLLPECEMHDLADGRPPVMLAETASSWLPALLDQILVPAKSDAEAAVKNRKGLESSIPACRYWAVLGLMSQGESAVAAEKSRLTSLLSDPSASVRIASAEALGRFCGAEGRRAALPVLTELSNPRGHGVVTAILALNSIDQLSPLPADVVAQLKANSPLPEGTPQRMREYVPRLIERITARAE
ncbi:Arylsulfatase precursor [Caulifigura coniformis]|uniref:Arylsulfatase n=1 Tax=Caulifigura coniformis TaxID=2527983 RepID=A0A517SN06_9PLAN|nr:sulfatase-like hydrolase/transferase [Caulifigura coniformis]QDT57486.1 Arylsulfatase precursor [Caulifigura coniformis]